MSTSFKEESFKSREAKIKKTSNRFLYMFLTIFITGYAIFFTSNLWLPNSYLGVEITPIGVTVNENERNVTIDEWTFSKEQRLMEIIVEIENLSIDGLHDYKWVVKTKDGALDTKIVASDNEFVILHAEKVPKDWTEASITMDLSEEDKENIDSWTPLVLYTNNKEVERVTSIKTRSLVDYKVAAYKKRIQTTEEAIKTAEADLAEIDRQIKEAENNIAALQEKMEFQTESEIEESNRQIDGFTGQLTTLQAAKSDKEKEIKELRQKIELTEKLLDKTQHPEDAENQEEAPQDKEDDSNEED